MSEEYPEGYDGGPPAVPEEPPPHYERTFFGSASRGNYLLTYAAPGYGAQPTAPNPQTIHSVDNEAALLGALMVMNDLIPTVSERVAAEDFFEPLHGRIFAAIVKLHERGRSPNPVLLRPIFEQDPDMRQLGGPAYLAGLTTSGAAAIGAVDFADKVAELAVRRKVGEAALSAVEQLCDASTDGGIEEVDDLVSRIQDVAFASMSRAQPMKARSAEWMVTRARDRAREIADQEEPAGAACVTIPDVDKIIGPAEPGLYAIIGGRPGMCKTTFACSMALGYAAGGVPTDYYHGEMTGDQIALRHTADLSHAMRMAIRHDRLKKGDDLSGREQDDLDRVRQLAKTLPLNFIETGDCDIRRVETAVARSALQWKNRGRRLGVVFVDYIQKYSATNARGQPITDDTEAVNAISKVLDRIAKKHGVAVFALSQLTRGVEDRKDKRPQMNDLRQSGKLEQDADAVILLFREEVYWAKERPKGKADDSPEMKSWYTHMECIRGQVELIGEKNRHGKPRTRTVKFFHPFYAIRGSDFDEGGFDPLIGQDMFPVLDDDDL